MVLRYFGRDQPTPSRSKTGMHYMQRVEVAAGIVVISVFPLFDRDGVSDSRPKLCSTIDFFTLFSMVTSHYDTLHFMFHWATHYLLLHFTSYRVENTTIGKSVKKNVWNYGRDPPTPSRSKSRKTEMSTLLRATLTHCSGVWSYISHPISMEIHSLDEAQNSTTGRDILIPTLSAHHGSFPK